MAETAGSKPSTAWNRTTKPAAVWAELALRASTDEERACVAAATRQADRVWVAMHSGLLKHSRTDAPVATSGRARKGQTPGVVPSRNADWHRLALSAYEVLRDSAAYGHLARLRPWACAAAEPVLAAWLRSPAPPEPGRDEGAQASVAQRLGVGDAVNRINGETQAAHLSTVLSAAQEAAVFGIPRHRIELVTAAGAHDKGTVVRVVVDTPGGIALASEPLELGVLIDEEASGIDAATTALRRVAQVASRLFEQHARAVWNSPPPIPANDRSATPTGRAFPELRLHERAAPPLDPTPAPRPGPALAPRTSPPPDTNRTGRSR